MQHDPRRWSDRGRNEAEISRRRLLGAGAAAAAGAALSARAPGLGAKPHRRAQAPRRRRDRRRRVRRADGGARDRAQGPLGDRARGPRPGRRPGAQRRHRRRRDHRARRHLRRPDAGPHARAGAEDEGRAPSRPTTPATTSTSPTGTRLRYSDTGPDRHRAARSGDPARPGDCRHPARRDGRPRSPSTRPGRRANAAEWDSQTLEQCIDQNSAHAAVPRRWSRSPPGRSSAPSRASSRCSSSLFYIAASGNEENVGTFERNFNTRGGAQESRFVGGSQLICERMAQKLGRRAGARSRRCAGSSRTAAGSPSAPTRVDVEAKRVIVAIPPVLTGRIDYEPDLPDRARRADRALPAGHADQGDRGLRPARSGATTGSPARCSPTRDRSTSPSTTRPRTAARASSSASSAATRRARSRSSSKPARRAAVLANYVEFFGAQAANPIEYIETIWKREKLDPRLPGRDPGPGDADRPRPGAAQAGRPHPLGRHRDLDLLERLHGRRRALGRARRGRGARAP